MISNILYTEISYQYEKEHIQDIVDCMNLLQSIKRDNLSWIIDREEEEDFKKKYSLTDEQFKEHIKKLQAHSVKINDFMNYMKDHYPQLKLRIKQNTGMS